MLFPKVSDIEPAHLERKAQVDAQRCSLKPEMVDFGMNPEPKSILEAKTPNTPALYP